MDLGENDHKTHLDDPCCHESFPKLREPRDLMRNMCHQSHHSEPSYDHLTLHKTMRTVEGMVRAPPGTARRLLSGYRSSVLNSLRAFFSHMCLQDWLMLVVLCAFALGFLLRCKPFYAGHRVATVVVALALSEHLQELPRS